MGQDGIGFHVPCAWTIDIYLKIWLTVGFMFIGLLDSPNEKAKFDFIPR